MSYLSNVLPEFEKAFALENLFLKIEENLFVVQDPSDQTVEEKVRRIIKSMNYCPLIFSSTHGAVKFTITPYAVPSRITKSQKTDENKALNWGIEVASSMAQPVSEFDSSLDPLLKQTLGENFFKHNVAKVFICGHPFILIADRHSQSCFRALLPRLIHEIHQRPDEKIALFIEGCGRDSFFETRCFSDHLNNVNSTIKYNPKKLLYGIEGCLAMMLSGCIKDMYNIRENNYTKNDQANLFYSLCYNPGFQKIWNKVKQNQLNSTDGRTMTKTIDQAIFVSQSQLHLGWQILEKSQFYHDLNSWMTLLKAFVNSILEESDFQGDIKIKAENFCANIKKDDLFIEVFETINQQIRDPLIVENIWSLIKNLPQTTEIALFVGYLHMQPVIQGLQKKN